MVAARPVSTSSQTSLAARFAESRRETRRTRAPFDRLRVNFSSISTILHLTVLALSERSESKCCRTRTRFSYGKSRGSTPCFPSRPSQATLRFASVAGLGLDFLMENPGEAPRASLLAQARQHFASLVLPD